jgi:hypothetical protein
MIVKSTIVNVYSTGHGRTIENSAFLAFSFIIRGHLLKGVAIFDAGGTNLWLKLLFQQTKVFIMNPAIRLKQ